MVESEGKSIAIMLSGGLDSSAIGLGISNLGYSNINSYSANFSHIKTPEHQTLDERNFQENIISKVGFYHKYIELEGCSPVNSLKESIDIFSEPIAFPNIYLFMEIAKAARNDQIDILLDGHDGDVTISHGYETLYDYFIKLKLIKFLYEIFSYARIKKISQLKALKIFLKPALQKIFRMTKKREIISKGLLDETFISDENLISDNARVYLSHEEKLKNPLLVLGNEYRYIFFKSFNIENRSPFYDEHLIRFCLDLPSKFKLSKGYTRKILRQFLEDRLGNEHAYRRDKAILSGGLVNNFTQNDFDQIKIEYMNIHPMIKDLIDRKKVERIFHDWQTKNSVSEVNIINMMYFFNLNIFMKRFF